MLRISGGVYVLQFIKFGSYCSILHASTVLGTLRISGAEKVNFLSRSSLRRSHKKFTAQKHALPTRISPTFNEDFCITSVCAWEWSVLMYPRESSKGPHQSERANSETHFLNNALPEVFWSAFSESLLSCRITSKSLLKLPKLCTNHATLHRVMKLMYSL